MTTKPSTIEQISIPEKSGEELEAYVEHHFKQVYGSGAYINDIYKASNNSLSITIGISFPKDVSDCRDRDNVIKFISIDEVADFSADLVDGEYIIELKSRDDVYQQFIDQKDQLRDQLDKAMARVTYDKIAQTSMVDNQLNPIKQILRWTRKYEPVPYTEVKKAQDKDGDKTLEYIHTLENLGFIKLQDGEIHSEDELNKYDLGEIGSEKFNQRILGDVVQKGYHQLSDKLGLTILRHYPKFANGYYLDALERHDSELWLDAEKIWENIEEWYGRQNTTHEFIIDDKLEKLVSLGILEKDEEYYSANQKVYNEFSQIASV